jgi:cytidyltransferase-like protein
VKIGIISGYFNPLHTGHLDYIESAKQNCDLLYAIVNSDRQVEIKGSESFMDEDSRLRIVKALQSVNRGLIAKDDDGTVVKSIEWVYNWNKNDPFIDSFVFMNGGDRVAGNTPEEEYCREVGIETLYNVGGGKTESSSKLLEKSKIRGV